MGMTSSLNSTIELGGSSTGRSLTTFDSLWFKARGGTVLASELAYSGDYKPITYVDIDLPPDKYGFGRITNQHDLTSPSPVSYFENVADPLDTVTEITLAFKTSESEDFEDGMDSILSENLADILQRRGWISVAGILAIILTEGVNRLVASEALKILGEVQDDATHQSRRQVLEYLMLEHPSAYIRDGAVYGLTTMNDPASIPAFKQALEKEDIPLLRHLIEIALEDLKG